MTTPKGTGMEWTDRTPIPFIFKSIESSAMLDMKLAPKHVLTGNTIKILFCWYQGSRNKFITKIQTAGHHRAYRSICLGGLSPLPLPSQTWRLIGDSYLFTGMPFLPRRLTDSTPWKKHRLICVKLLNSAEQIRRSTYIKEKPIVLKTGMLILNLWNNLESHPSLAEDPSMSSHCTWNVFPTPDHSFDALKDPETWQTVFGLKVFASTCPTAQNVLHSLTFHS